MIRRSPLMMVFTLAIVGLVLVVVTLPLTIPVFATLSYRSAVHSLHRELRPVFPDSAELVDEGIDNCWNGVAAASVRTFVPKQGTDDADLRALAREIRAAIDDAGFSDTQDGRLSRERDDALDSDIVLVEVVDEEVRVVADVFDADSVFCLPG